MKSPKCIIHTLHITWHGITHLNPHPVASEHRWLVKAPRWIHSVPDVSGRWSWPCGCHARLWNLHDVTNAAPFVNIVSPGSRSVKRHQWKHRLDYYGAVFAHLATGCGIIARDLSGLDSDRWIPHSRCCENNARAKALAGFSRHLSAGFTDLNPAPRGLSLYTHTYICIYTHTYIWYYNKYNDNTS